jgi:hypothetical protein
MRCALSHSPVRCNDGDIRALLLLVVVYMSSFVYSFVFLACWVCQTSVRGELGPVLRFPSKNLRAVTP